ncbi:hypothetical protein JXA70_00630 [candidate division KSB1 bacterium]|nr:hypothetical protein [candidate division KSB1 bacterium]
MRLSLSWREFAFQKKFGLHVLARKLTLPFRSHPRQDHDYARALQAIQNGETEPDGILTWASEFADVSAAEDLGYSWG